MRIAPTPAALQQRRNLESLSVGSPGRELSFDLASKIFA
jgi:hypothetical protein